MLLMPKGKSGLIRLNVGFLLACSLLLRGVSCFKLTRGRISFPPKLISFFWRYS